MPRYDDRKHYFATLVEGRVFQLVRRGALRQAKREALELLRNSALREYCTGR